MARKTIQISPSQLKQLRNKAKLTQRQAASSVHLSLRQWQKFEESELSNTHVRIPDATLELFCIKVGIKFPPIFGKQYRYGKTISFAGGPGGIGRSTLTRDISVLLAQDNFEALIITDKSGQLIFSEKRSIANNTEFPKILFIDDISFDNEDRFKASFSKVRQSYDFIFFDLEKEQAHLGVDKYPIDLIITPTNPEHHPSVSISNLSDFHKRASHSNSEVILSSLLLGINEDYAFDHYYHGLDSYISSSVIEELNTEAFFFRSQQESCFNELDNLKKLGIHVFNAYSSKIYNMYSSDYIQENGFFSTGYHFIDNKNTLSAHQMQSIKNEILRLLKVTK